MTHPPGVCSISVRWVYKIKPEINGGPEKFKARIVA